MCSCFVLCLTLCGCCMFHDWQEASCTEAKNCLKCDEQQGESLGHDWLAATCSMPKTCSRCMITEGDPLGHWIEPWYSSVENVGTIEKKCKLCGMITATALEVEINIDNYKQYFDFYYDDITTKEVGGTDKHTALYKPFYCKLKDSYTLADIDSNKVAFYYEYDRRLKQFYGGTEISESTFDVFGTAISDRIADHYTEKLIWDGEAARFFVDAISDATYVMFTTHENMIVSDVSGTIYLILEET